MKIDKRSLLNLDEVGVYKIVCIPTKKVYVGSTCQSFTERFKQHYSDLCRGVHKNAYLQFAWDKYGEDSFKFYVIETCTKKECFIKEQHWMDKLNVCDKKYGYNINPLATGTPNLSKETIDKRSKYIKETQSAASEYYFKIKRGEIKLDQVPDKYLTLVKYRLEQVPWNKGKLGDEVDYSYLKGVKKTKTDKYKKGREDFKNTQRNKSKAILVYDYRGKFLGKYRSCTDLQEMEHSFPLILRCADGRNGIPKRKLKAQNINNVCHHRMIQYKGLIFRFEGDKTPVKPLKPSDIHPDWKEFNKKHFA